MRQSDDPIDAQSHILPQDDVQYRLDVPAQYMDEVWELVHILDFDPYYDQLHYQQLRQQQHPMLNLLRLHPVLDQQRIRQQRLLLCQLLG
jgi:hypothetical protein